MQQSTFGFNITVSTGLDLTGSSPIKFRIKKPDDTSFERTATISGNPALGTAFWEVTSGDLDQAGSYELQLIDLTLGRVQFSNIGIFEVYGNLTPPNGISP